MSLLIRRSLVTLIFLGPALACGPANQSPQPAVAQTANRPEGASPAAAEPPIQMSRPDAGTAWVMFGTDTIVVEVASTGAERAKGLMDREDVPDGTGMLFVFKNSEVRAFWMKDTFVALDIAYINESFAIIDIKQLEPENTVPVESSGPASFALEVRQGWFEEHGIQIGDVASVTFGPGLRVN